MPLIFGPEPIALGTVRKGPSTDIWIPLGVPGGEIWGGGELLASGFVEGWSVESEKATCDNFETPAPGRTRIVCENLGGWRKG